MPSEPTWKVIEEYSKYQVSSVGHVKNIKKDVRLTPQLDKNGYHYVNLYGDDKKQHRCMIHRLVCDKFIPNPDELPIVNHKNGQRSDNRLENLEWVSHTDNNVDAYERGRKATKKIVIQLDSDRNIVKMHNSLKEANSAMKVSSHNNKIHFAISLGTLAHGFYWKFEEENYTKPLILNPNSNLLFYALIPGFSGYEVSEYGEVYNISMKRFLKPEICTGYKRVYYDR